MKEKESKGLHQLAKELSMKSDEELFDIFYKNSKVFRKTVDALKKQQDSYLVLDTQRLLHSVNVKDIDYVQLVTPVDFQ